MSDNAERGRRAWDSLLPLLFGLVMGLLTGFSAVNGRITALETKQNATEAQLHDVTQSLRELTELKTAIAQLQASIDSRRGKS